MRFDRPRSNPAMQNLPIMLEQPPPSSAGLTGRSMPIRGGSRMPARIRSGDMPIAPVPTGIAYGMGRPVKPADDTDGCLGNAVLFRRRLLPRGSHARVPAVRTEPTELARARSPSSPASYSNQVFRTGLIAGAISSARSRGAVTRRDRSCRIRSSVWPERS
jgi:hypothetical protein